jgi:hypothetical protein
MNSLSGALLKKTAEEAFKKEKDEQDKKESLLSQELESKKKEIVAMQAEIEKLDQDFKKNQKRLLIGEIRNEIVVNMV